MFENRQDTILLQSALVSAVALINSNEEPGKNESFHLSDKNGSVEAVSSTIVALTRYTEKTETEKAFLDRQLKLNRRCHAAVFFHALRSHEISCEAATAHYQSIAYTLPTLNWMFYVKLNFECSWSEYFVECAKQLPSDILALVVKKIIAIRFMEKQLKHYAWHLSLQAIIHNFFIMVVPTLCDFSENCSFSFPFIDMIAEKAFHTDAYNNVQDGTYARSQLLHAYVTLLNQLLESINSCLDNVDFTKVVFHGYKTIFELILNIKDHEVDSVKELFRLNGLLKQCISEPMSQNAIQSSLDKRVTRLFDHTYMTASWEIDVNYLMFVLCNYWDSVVSKRSALETTAPFNLTASVVLSNALHKDLRKLCTIFKDSFTESDKSCIDLLRAVLTYHYPSASEAAEILLVHREVREEKEILSVLENNALLLSPYGTYKLLANSVVDAKAEDVKLRFLKLFFLTLSRASPEIYNDALQYIFEKWGWTENFTSFDFHTQVLQLERRTLTLQEAEEILLPWFIQCPSFVLRILIEQALSKGSEGMAIIPVLRLIPVACTHKDSLMNELSPYFARNELQNQERKYIASLITSVMEVHAEKNIISLDVFLKECIISNLTVHKKYKVDLALDCLNACLEVLVNKEALGINLSILMSLIKCLSSLIHSCIVTANGRQKESALKALSYLKKHVEQSAELSVGRKGDLQSIISCFDPAVKVYTARFLGITRYEDMLNSTSLHMCKLLWIWCCSNQDWNLFQECISRKKVCYEKLLCIIISLLPHFTKEEWINSAHLIELCFKLTPHIFPSSIPALLPHNNPQLYATVRCLLDCFHFVLINQSIEEIQYLSNCFTNTVMSLLPQDVHPNLLINIFIDTCHFVSSAKMDILPVISSFLVEFKKLLNSTIKNKVLQENYLKVLYSSLKVLPDSEDKDKLLQAFK